MSERSSDKMVEAFMQFQSWDSCPHDPIPVMPTAVSCISNKIKIE